MPDVQPYTKDSQLKPGRPRRYRRKVAGPKQWQAIQAEKGSVCRLSDVALDEVHHEHIDYHHLVSRARGGDDVADNIVPLCLFCHISVTTDSPRPCALLAERLTDAEYAYIIGKLGEAGPERLFGVNRG